MLSSKLFGPLLLVLNIAHVSACLMPGQNVPELRNLSMTNGPQTVSRGAQLSPYGDTRTAPVGRAGQMSEGKHQKSKWPGDRNRQELDDLEKEAIAGDIVARMTNRCPCGVE